MNFFRSQPQKEFAERLAVYLKSGGAPLLLEGAAGLGKTRAYLKAVFDLLEANRKLGKQGRVTICFPTRALAQQLLYSTDLAAVQDLRTQNHLSPLTVIFFTPRDHFQTHAEYKAHKEECANADVFLCTHQAALIDALSASDFLGLKNDLAVLFDEADQLPEAAALRTTHALPADVLRSAGAKKTGKSAADMKKACADVLLFLKKQPLLEETSEIKAACNAIINAVDTPAWYKKISWSAQGDLVLEHKLPARLLTPLIAAQTRLVFISATLSLNNTFDDFKRALGLKERPGQRTAISPLSAKIEPREHGQLDFTHAAWDYSDPDHFDKVEKHLRGVIEDNGGAVLVITTSHQDTQILASKLTDIGVARVEGETTGEAAERMLKEEKIVLIAAGAWAGLDTQIKWRHVMMPKVPFGIPSEMDKDEASRYVDSKNTALRRVRQGIARGLRAPDAVCTVHFLEKRFENLAKYVIPIRFQQEYKAKYAVGEVRTRQSEFRKKIMQRFQGRCVISGCSEPSVLQAAHLSKRGEWRTNHDKGILLKSDLHLLMDAGKLEIVGNVVRVFVDDPEFKKYDGKIIDLEGQNKI